MPYTTLISTEALYRHMGDPDWVILDCRFDLAKPDWGYEDYQRAHIPGSVYTHLDRDLSGIITPHSGRHPLPEMEDFVHRLMEWGIKPDSQVVVYDTSSGTFAARLWWMLRYYQYARVALLDGGLNQWSNETRPLISGVEKRHPSATHPTLSANTGMIAFVEEVDRIRQNDTYCLIDARAPERYRGDMELIDPIAGHIPGAFNRFSGENLRDDGCFKSGAELRSEFSKLMQNVPPERTVVYCGSGVTSCHHLVALEHAGLPGARLYLGSWSQWIRDPNRAREPLGLTSNAG